MFNALTYAYLIGIAFMPAQHPSLLRISFTLIATICIGEGLIMLILPLFGPMSVAATALLDATLLAVLMIPIVIWRVTNPAKQYITALKTEKSKAHAREDHMLSVLNSLALVKDNETGTHIIRTQKYVGLLAYRLREMGQYVDCLDDEFILKIIKVAPLHDLGKVGIPDQILHKQGKFTASEREIINRHPLIGESILAAANLNIDDDFMVTAIHVAGTHHEKWDGSGYPRNLRGNEIPLAGRIMAVADVYDALVTERPYKKLWTHEQVVEEIIKNKGIAFDPIVIEAFVLEQDHFKEVLERYRDN